MSNVLPLFTFPSSNWFQELSKFDKIELEVHENWVKQSFRSRYQIAGPNGLQSLSIPTIKKTRKRFKDVEISYTEDWVTNHLRSIKTAYNRSPFYEYYAHKYENILSRKPTYLVDLNLEAIEFGITSFQLESTVAFTEQYLEMPSGKKQASSQPIVYNQVFEDKHGFIDNLSFLDLLFNCGPSAGSYLL